MSHGEAGPEAPALRGLRWGIKASFLGYIARLPDGQAALGAGVEAIDDRDVVFPFLPDPETSPGPPGPERVLRFGGEVRFGGHHGLLFVRLAEPWLHLRADVGHLSVADPMLEDPTLRTPLVRFTRPAGLLEPGWRAAEVSLDEDGIAVFGDIYAPGEDFDPLSLV